MDEREEENDEKILFSVEDILKNEQIKKIQILQMSVDGFHFLNSNMK